MNAFDGRSCFLCSPDPGLVYARANGFFAMLGHGPLGVGYSLIATEEHVPSMFDLDTAKAVALEGFTAEVRETIHAQWAARTGIGEHGRVAVCVSAATSRYEPHCLHAHRLVFPDPPMVDIAPLGLVEHYDSFAEAFAHGHEQDGQYLYWERPDGTCDVAWPDGPVPRQAIRQIVASGLGRPEDADWRAHPALDAVEAARNELALGPR
jgi:hypothetical protein